MKKPGKHYAGALYIPGIPHPVMGRPKGGRELASFFISGAYVAMIEKLAVDAGVTRSRMLEDLVAQAIDKAKV